ncbi:MAG TPA: hypothetical protein VIE88_17775, partial [Vicinamibacteria bacterium]
ATSFALMSLRLSTKLVAVAMVLLIAVPFFLRLSLLKTRGFNPDELECIHWAWCVSKGMVPYRDYFDHHTPWFHYFLSSFLRFYDVERVPAEAVAFLFMARTLTWVFAGAVIASTFFLGRLFRDTLTGVVAALLLSNASFFFSKSLEVRADVPAAALVVAAVHLALVGHRRQFADAGGAKMRLFASGLALGAATMLTQKVLFVGPGFALAALWLLLDPRLPSSRGKRFALVALQSVGFLLPLGATLAYFASKSALWHFIEANLLVNARWPGLSAGPFLVELVRQDPVYVLLGCAGLGYVTASAFRPSGIERMDAVATLPMLSLILTLPFHTGMSYQHFLLVLPLFSIFAAFCLVGLIARLSRGADAALLAALVLLSIVPALRFRDAFDRGNWGTLQGIEYVLRNSSPRETTFDGFTGLGLFRPQAFYHHFQHPHAFALQSEEEHREMLGALESGRALPKMIFWSHYLKEAVTPEIAAFLERNYVASGLDPIRIRPFDNGVGFWSDVEPRHLGWDPDADPNAPHVFFDDGWRPPTFEFGAYVRRTRTRRSGLIVPIRRPRDFEVVLQAHADPDAGPFGVELVVNGESAGVAEAVPRWQEYSFPVTVHRLRPGFNAFELRFSAPDDAPDRKLELAVSFLQLRESRARE